MDTPVFLLAEIVKRYRIKSGLTQHDVAIKSDITNSTISKIENGKRSHPELRSIQAIASVLKIPYNVYMEPYIDLEKSAGSMLKIFNEAVLNHNQHHKLITDMFQRYVELSEDSYDAVETIYNIVSKIRDAALKLALYKSIIDYSLNHGIMPHLAKSSFQEYLIERNDRTRLKETYQSGRYVLKFVDFCHRKKKFLFTTNLRSIRLC